MYVLKEAIEFDVDPILGEPEEVHYQTPEDLKVHGDPTPDIVHDDNTQQDTQQAEVPDQEQKPAAVPQTEDIPSEEEEQEETPVEFTPSDAIKQVKANPLTLPIAKYHGNFYIDHNDFRHYMEASREMQYESAIEKIVEAHNDKNMSKDNIIIIMGENDLSNIDSETKEIMEYSSVRFEVYK